MSNYAFQAHGIPVQNPLVGALEKLAYEGLFPPTFFAGAAASITYLACGEISLPAMVVIWLVTYASYRIDCLAEVGEFDSSLASKRSQANSHSAWARAKVACALVLAAGLAVAYSNLAAIVFLFVFPISVALYGTPLVGRILSGRTFFARRLKDIPRFKSFYIAFFVGLLGPYCLVFAGYSGHWGAHVLAFAFLAYRAFLNATFCDIKDLERDRAAGVMTLMVCYGEARVVKWLRIFNALTFISVAMTIVAGWVAPSAWALCLTVVYFEMTIRLVQKKKIDAERACLLLMDTEWILWPVYLWVGQTWL